VHLVRSFCFLHVGQKIDGCLRCASIFAAGNHQDRTFEFLKALYVDLVNAGPLNHHCRTRLFRVVQSCIEGFLVAHAKSNGRHLYAWMLQIVKSRLQNLIGWLSVYGLHQLHSFLMARC